MQVMIMIASGFFSWYDTQLLWHSIYSIQQAFNDQRFYFVEIIKKEKKHGGLSAFWQINILPTTFKSTSRQQLFLLICTANYRWSVNAHI